LASVVDNAVSAKEPGLFGTKRTEKEIKTWKY